MMNFSDVSIGIFVLLFYASDAHREAICQQVYLISSFREFGEHELDYDHFSAEDFLPAGEDVTVRGLFAKDS